MKITIDPGHGYNANHSPVVDAYYEGTRMYELAYILADELQAYNIDVVVTRSTINDDPAVYDRGKLAGTNGSELFISLHSNATGKSSDGTYDQSVSGTTVYRSLTNDESQTLGEALGNAVANVMGHKFRGCKTKKYSDSKPKTDYYGVIRGAAENGCSTAFIIEHGFHTNVDDATFLLDDENLKAIAKAEAKVIVEHYGLIKQSTDECKVEEYVTQLETEVVELRQLISDLTERVKQLEKMVNTGSMVINGTIAYKTLD